VRAGSEGGGTDNLHALKREGKTTCRKDRGRGEGGGGNLLVSKSPTENEGNVLQRGHRM